MTNPAGRRLILIAMWQVSAASYVGSTGPTEPRPFKKDRAAWGEMRSYTSGIKSTLGAAATLQMSISGLGSIWILAGLIR
jgi:hypothetical protein